jgi:cytochrome P450
VSLGTVVRWLPRHGLARVLLNRAARQGDLRARMICDPAAAAEPFAMYERFRAQGPLVRGRLMWTTVDHRIADHVLRSDAFGTPADPQRLPRPLRALARMFPDELTAGPVDPPSMLATDPPDHTRYRRLVAKVFTARAIESLRGRTEQLTDELLDRLGDGPSTADLVHAFAAPLPVTVIAEVLGVPVGARDRLLAWGNAATPALDMGLSYRRFATTEAGIRSFNGFLSGHLDRLAREPGDDILSQLVTASTRATDHDQRLTRAELLSLAGLLLAAGFETTVNLIGNGAVLLLRHPDQLQLLRDRPQLWPNAVEEILRYDSPVQNTARSALHDTELDGVRLRQGAIVAVLLGGVNRDPRVFPNPDRFDVTRPNARDHLAFSAGAHFCLGEALARMEGEIALRRLFERFPDLRLAAEPVRQPTRTLRGYARVPVGVRSVQEERLLGA